MKYRHMLMRKDKRREDTPVNNVSNQKQASVEQDFSLNQTSKENQNAEQPSLPTALSQLLQHYLKAIIKPSVATYSEGPAASWSLVWIQLLTWAILDAVLGSVVNLISPLAKGSSFQQIVSIASSIGLIVVVPTLFFLLMGVVYLLARAFGGQGTFLDQCNTSLHIQVPLGISSKVLALVPVIGRILNSVLSLYGIVLQVIVIMAVHRLNAGKAIAVILLPIGAIAVLAGAYLLLVR